MPALGKGFVRRQLVSTDVKGYGGRDDRQHAVLAVSCTAAERAGLDRPAWRRWRTGNGELAVLYDSGDEPRVVDDFVRELTAGRADDSYDLRRDSAAPEPGRTQRGQQQTADVINNFMAEVSASKSVFDISNRGG